MTDAFKYGQQDLIYQLNQLARAKDIVDIPQNSAAAAASAAASVAAAAAAAESDGTAATAASKAAAALKSLDARYLGAKALPPDVDNNGDVLLAGATYWDTVLNGGCLRVFQAGAWVTIPTNVASQISSTPVGGIVATDVQAALAELDAKKAARATTLAGYGITDALSGAYKPAWSDIAGRPSLAAVATSGNKADVGLGSVDNTPDSAKPVSIAQRAELDQKAGLAGSATQPFNLASINGGPVGGSRNRILNGSFRVNQRGVTGTSTDNVYISDGWRSGISALVSTFANYGVNYNGPVSANGYPGAYIQTAKIKPSLTPSDYVGLGTAIEGVHIADFLFGTPAAKSISVSFRAHASVATTIAVTVRNGTSDRSYVAPVALAAGPGSYVVVIPGDIAGNWRNDTGLGMSLWFFVACGSAFHAPTANSWNTGNNFGHSSVSNILDAAERFVTISDVQLEKGPVTPLCIEEPGALLMACLRRCRVINMAMGYISAATHARYIHHGPPMRGAPSMSFNGPQTGAIGNAAGDNGTPTNILYTQIYPDGSLFWGCNTVAMPHAMSGMATTYLGSIVASADL